MQSGREREIESMMGERERETATDNCVQVKQLGKQRHYDADDYDFVNDDDDVCHDHDDKVDDDGVIFVVVLVVVVVVVALSRCL